MASFALRVLDIPTAARQALPGALRLWVGDALKAEAEARINLLPNLPDAVVQNEPT